jgi:hypothetical protein
METNEVKIGDVLYHVYADSRMGQSKEVTVLTVGKIWVTVEGLRHRFRKTDLRSETGRSVLWLSKALYDSEKDHRDAWETLRSFVSRRTQPPAGVTTEAMRQALTLLKLENAD